MASSLAVELCVSLLHHPLRHNAPASSCSALDNAPSDHPLGVLPHQIRGFLSSFQNVLLHGERFDNCTACSSAILQHYRDAPSEFLLNALTRPEYLEELSGLSALKQSVDEAQFDDFDDE
jgi:ubiquitin-like modifier-activating enzyme ATG7